MIMSSMHACMHALQGMERFHATPALEAAHHGILNTCFCSLWPKRCNNSFIHSGLYVLRLHSKSPALLRCALHTLLLSILRWLRTGRCLGPAGM